MRGQSFEVLSQDLSGSAAGLGPGLRVPPGFRAGQPQPSPRPASASPPPIPELASLQPSHPPSLCWSSFEVRRDTGDKRVIDVFPSFPPALGQPDLSLLPQSDQRPRGCEYLAGSREVSGGRDHCRGLQRQLSPGGCAVGAGAGEQRQAGPGAIVPGVDGGRLGPGSRALMEGC